MGNSIFIHKWMRKTFPNVTSNLCDLCWHQLQLSWVSNYSRCWIEGEQAWCSSTPCKRFVWAPISALCILDFSFGTLGIPLESCLVSFQASLWTVWRPVPSFVTAAHHLYKIWLICLWQHDAEKDRFLNEKFSPFPPWGSNLTLPVISKGIELGRCGWRHLIRNSM